MDGGGAQDEDDNEQTAVVSPAVSYEVLEMAAIYNNQALVLDWLENCKDQQDYQWRGSLLSRAAYYHSVDVVKCIVSFGNCDDIVNHLDPKGKTPLHYAAEGSIQTDINPVDLAKDMVDIIGCLFNNGADPTVKCKDGRTPKDIVKNNFKLGAALFEILECIWSKEHISDVTASNDKICLHKELLQWAAKSQHEKIITCILRMNISSLSDQPCTEVVQPHNKPVSVQDITKAQFLLGTTEGLYTNTLIHGAANVGNMKLLETLIICSGLPLNVLINLRWRKFSEHFEPNVVAVVSDHTPLSLGLSHPSYSNFIEIFAKLQSEGDCVTHIDLSHTMVDCLPQELLNLSSISNLNASNNMLTNLSLLGKQFVSLRFAYLNDLNLSKNNLSSLPIETFHLPALKILDVSHNPLNHLPEWWWLSSSLVKLNVSTTHLTELCLHGNAKKTHAAQDIEIKDGCQLQELDISSSRLESFPKYLACYFPNLKRLNVSRNGITACCAINELPPLLEELDISHNILQSEQSEDYSVFYLSAKEDTAYYHLNTKFDCSLRCSHMCHKQLKHLRTLNLSDNEALQNVVFHYEDLTASTNSACLFFPKLKKLSLNNCGLLHTPLQLSRMSRIYHLNIGNNKMNVPREICNLTELSTFIYEGLQDPVVADLSKFTSVKDQLLFLSQENAERAPSLKLMLVGLSGRGKSTLLSHLKQIRKTQSLPITHRQRWQSSNTHVTSPVTTEEIQSTIGIDQDIWYCTKSKDVSDTICITFYVWDFAGQEEYSAAHQCFITDNSLYVLCWRACDGEDGIYELKEWLLSIKARAKSAVVVIVGTHIDKVKRFRLEKKEIYTNKIMELYYNQSYYPTIKEIKFVCCDINSPKYQKHKEYITELRDTLYDVASDMKLSLGGGRRFEQRLIDMMIPKSYLELQQRIHSEANYLKQHQEKGPPILSWNDIFKLGKQCGLKEDNEIAVAIKYAKDQGRLMHFDSVALKDLYFVDSQWLCDMFAHVVSLEFNCDFVVDGKANRQALELSLTEKFRIPKHFMEAVIKLLSEFELAIPLDGNTFLIPSLLLSRETKGLEFSEESYYFPRNDNDTKYKNAKRISLSYLNSSSLPTNTECSIVVSRPICTREIILNSTDMCYRRIFVADYIPVNFWPRVIARFLSSAESFQKIICSNCFADVGFERFVEVGNASIGDLPCRWSYGKNHIILTLGNDVILRINGLYSFKNVGNKRERIPISCSVSKLKEMHIHHGSAGFKLVNVNDDGFEITIPDYVVYSRKNDLVHESKLMSAQILSHVLETIDEVLKDWFEGLLEEGIYSDKYLMHIIPCPYCFGDVKPDDILDTSPKEELLKNSSNDMQSLGVSNGRVGFSLQYCLYQARRSNFVKCFNCTCGKSLQLKYLTPDLMFEDKKFTKISHKLLKTDKKQLLGKGGFGAVYKAEYCMDLDPSRDVALKCITEQDVKDLSSEDLCQAYADVRLEFNKLISIDHHHIVKCIGFCVMSLSFVLELAPCGSLKSIIERHRKNGFYICPNSLVDIVKQASSALDYLHTKKFIVHNDIKPGNILVFDFPTVGHDCFDEKSQNFMCKFCEDHVKVKLADFGMSAFVGPRGFHRKPATPGHTAPEAIEYAGKEPLGEKVDIFSLGITLYELMTLEFLPPSDTNAQEFNNDIKDGIRPPFLDEVTVKNVARVDPKTNQLMYNPTYDELYIPKVPNYPLYPAIIKELVVNCWAQEYAARPSAGEIVSILQSPDCLKLSNAYNTTNLPYSTVSAALVVTVDDQQSLWLAHSVNNQHIVTVYGFSEELSSNMFNKPKSIDVQGSILGMCQDGIYVWMAIGDGSLKAVSAQAFTVERQINKLTMEARDNLVHIISLTDHAKSTTLVLGYEDGLIVIVKSCPQFAPGIEAMSFGLDVFSSIENKLSTVQLTSSQLYTIEKSHQFEIWCGCENASIEIVSLSNNAFPLRFSTHVSSADIPQDVAIVQLKSSFSTTAGHMMYALHGCGSVISCWSVREQPVLKNVIKLTQLSSPAKEIFSLIKDTLIITDDGGKVYQLSHDNNGDVLRCQQLPSSHQPGEKMYLFSLCGKMSSKGSLCRIGKLATHVSSAKLPDYANIFFVVKSFPCTVLLGLSAGHRIFQVTDDHCPSLYFKTWTFPDCEQ